MVGGPSVGNTLKTYTKMHFTKIHHIAIICSDYETSKRFYTDILGFVPIKETYRAERQSYKLDLAFEVDDIEKAVSYLKKKGVTTEPLRTDEITHKRFTFFQDPDQLPLEIYEH